MIALLGLAVLLALPMGMQSVHADEPVEDGVPSFRTLPDHIEGGTEKINHPLTGINPNVSKSLWCTFTSGADNPHLSSTGFAASAHGWWVATSPNCPEYADVSITLWGYYCSWAGVGPELCDYRLLNSNEHRIRSGGGSSRRVAVRNDCVHIGMVGYRSIVDVDIVGYPDGYNLVDRYADVPCYPDH